MIKELNTESFNEVIKEGIQFVDLYADWCFPCKMMMPVIEEVSNDLKMVSFNKINVDLNQEIAIKYNVQTIPRFLVFKDGELKATFIGAREKEQLIKEIESCIK